MPYVQVSETTMTPDSDLCFMIFDKVYETVGWRIVSADMFFAFDFWLYYFGKLFT